MGNKQQPKHDQTNLQLSYERFQQNNKPLDANEDTAVAKQSRICLDHFKSMDIGLENGRGKDFEFKRGDKGVVISKYYETLNDLERYTSNIIKMSKLLDVVLYDELKIYNCEPPYSSCITIEAGHIEQLGPQFVKRSNYNRKIELLYFVASFLKKVGNLYICPDFIAENGNNGFLLINFATAQLFSSAEILLGFFRWLFTANQDFAACLTTEAMQLSVPIYLQEIYACLQYDGTLTMEQVESQLKTVQDKMTFFMNKTDSFYACQYFNKTQRYTAKSDWIFLQFKNEIFFYHLQDQHPFTGRLIRKKKKVDISDRHIVFDHEDLEILYVPENSKFIVKASEFEFEGSSSISDIEVKYRLPIKFKNALMNRAKNGEILLLEQNLYRYSPQTNKLVQQTKRISDYIFLTSTRDSIPFIVKLSIDIFRNGIRVLYKNEELVLAHAGEEKKLEQISTIRVDLRTVIFCIEVYKGVFLMMASKNLWILDLNFQCYFSFATHTQLKKLASFQNEKRQGEHQYHDQLYSVQNQPFRVNFSIEGDGNNVAVKDNYLHILGLVEDQPYYLKYRFIHRIGALRLVGYYPLFVQSSFRPILPHAGATEFQDYKFNFHQENSYLYKYRTWIFKGTLMVYVEDFRIKFLKNTYEVHLRIERISQTLKEHIEKLNAHQKRLSKIEQTLLLYKIYSIYEHLFVNSIVHSNISINHICFTEEKELKIHGWSEPPRNWHVSDYKDYLLVCFNVITYNTYEKVSDKILNKHEKELAAYPVLSDKILAAFKQTKTIEKHADIEKSLLLIKSALEKQLCSTLHSRTSNKFILSFEYRTPRMAILNIETQKMKKVTIVPEETVGEEFIFSETDKCLWNEKMSKLYILTANHQFFELKISTETNAEQKICLEDYEYLPHSISLSSFVCMQEGDIYSFGGIKKEADGRSTYCTRVYKFNWKALTWNHVCELPEPRINPHLVVSACLRFVYIIGGETHLEYPCLKILKFDAVTKSCQVLIDRRSINIVAHQNSLAPMKVFHLSEELQLFAFWSIEDGDYIIRYVSFSSIGFDMELRVKNYSSENVLAEGSVSLHENVVHILRNYGKYTKLTVHKMESLSLKNETIYPI